MRRLAVRIAVGATICFGVTAAEMSVVHAMGADGIADTRISTLERRGVSAWKHRSGHDGRLLKASYAPGVIARRVNGHLVITQAAYPGRSPFLCTPSGFGQTSTCRPR